MENQTPNVQPAPEKKPKKTSHLGIMVLLALLLGAIIAVAYFYFIPEGML